MIILIVVLQSLLIYPVAPARPVTTFSQLPACNPSTQGQMYTITDGGIAPSSLASATGGGSVKIGVMCNGTNWIIQ